MLNLFSQFFLVFPSFSQFFPSFSQFSTVFPSFSQFFLVFLSCSQCFVVFLSFSQVIVVVMFWICVECFGLLARLLTIFWPGTYAKTLQQGSQQRKLQKDKEKYVFLSLFLGFSCFFAGFLCFPLDFCKGRISKNTLQLALNTPKNPSLTNFLCFDPCITRSKSPQYKNL